MKLFGEPARIRGFETALRSYLLAPEHPERSSLLGKVDGCGFTLLVISSEQDGHDWASVQLGNPSSAVGLIADAWQACAKQGIQSLLARLPSGVDLVDPPAMVAFAGDKPWERVLLCCQQPGQRSIFISLVSPISYLPLRLRGLLYLVNQWQIEQGRLPLHAAAVERDGEVFLFSGVSGAGKSTVAMLSAGRSLAVLDDDQVLLAGGQGGGWRVDGWSDAKSDGGGRLRAVFKLVKAETDAVSPMGRFEGARFLFERHLDLGGRVFTPERGRSVLRLVSKVAREVPIHELRFRRSPDFWDVIAAAGI